MFTSAQVVPGIYRYIDSVVFRVSSRGLNNIQVNEGRSYEGDRERPRLDPRSG